MRYNPVPLPNIANSTESGVTVATPSGISFMQASKTLLFALPFIEGKVDLPKQIGPLIIRASYDAVKTIDNCVAELKRQFRTVETSGNVNGDPVIQGRS
jgi:hypothetical protein